MMNTPVRVGQKVQFDPWDDIKGIGIKDVCSTVTGKIVAVYPAHKWFSVVYGNHRLRTSFKFSDIGNEVVILG